MKKKYASLFYFTFLILIISACASAPGTTSGSGSPTGNKTSTTGTSGNGGKAEDLSKYRPKFTVPPVTTGSSAAVTASLGTGAMPTGHINMRVAALMDTVAAINKSVRYAQGYRVQAYSGTERKAAMDIRSAIVARLPDDAVHLQYKQPTFRVKVGDYFTRVEAQQALRRIRDLSPMATIVVDQINVK